MKKKYQKMHFKEVTPEETVENLIAKFEELNIKVKEIWQKESSIGTYALRLVVEGTNIGTNGKGVTKAFARASAYAEFFERYQNNMLTYNIDAKDIGYDFHNSPDEKIMTAEELVQENSSFINYYFEATCNQTKSFNEKVAIFKAMQKSEQLIHGKENYYVSLPFYSTRDKQVVHLPQVVYRMFYGSNGMCAGNGNAEAIVQGLSEIVERYIQKKILVEKPCLPDVPYEYIEKFPYIKNMFDKLNEYGGYSVKVKDCSFGGKYPVAALLIHDKNSGKYGIKLGCHPDFGIAMERAFTEAAQGQDVLEYSTRSQIDFFNRNVDNPFNIYNSFKTGLGQFPFQLFGNEPTFPFIPVDDVSQMTNEEVLDKWVREFEEDGYDILIRDVSVTGFPSFHIIIPGFSEITLINDKHLRAYNTRTLVSGLLMKPELITKKNCKYIRGTMEYFLNSILENTMSTYRLRLDNSNVPGRNIGAECLYMIAMCYLMEENYESAAQVLQKICMKAEKRGISQEEKNKFRAIYYYSSAMAVLGDSSKVMDYLECILDRSLTDYVKDFFDDLDTLILKQYSYTELSPEYKQYQSTMFKLYALLNERSIDQKHLKEMFSSKVLV